jgi:hypothetical protein
MGSNKTEDFVPKPGSKASKPAGDLVGAFRRQIYDDGRVHFHDDENGLVFEWASRRGFYMAFERVKAACGQIQEGGKLVMVGSMTASAGRKAAAIVWTRTNGVLQWTLEECNSAIQSANFVVRNEPALEDMDDWINRNV